jgi:hypothetical protein
VLFTITFETLQQLFYIQKYDLAQGVGFLDLLQKQAFKWIIWLLVGLAIFRYAKHQRKITEFTPNYFLKYALFIFFLVVLNIMIISFIMLLINEGTFDLQLLLNEYIPFYIYQKSYIYLLGYGSIALTLHFYFVTEKLQIEVQELSELKNNNRALYEKLKSKIDDKTTILNIKVGNKRKIISTKEIIWIEADDYCAKVHLLNGKSYTMRSTLKVLEEKLQLPFMRVHRKAIVNMTMATELNTSNAPSLTLNNNIQIPVSRSNLSALKNFTL